MGDLFLLNTRCELTNTIRRAFEVRRHFLLSPCVVQLELFYYPHVVQSELFIIPMCCGAGAFSRKPEPLRSLFGRARRAEPLGRRHAPAPIDIKVQINLENLKLFLVYMFRFSL